MLNLGVLDNYHLVSNHPFGSNAVEKVIGWQLQRILEEMDYIDQSGFRLEYRRETIGMVLLDYLWKVGFGRNVFNEMCFYLS